MACNQPIATTLSTIYDVCLHDIGVRHTSTKRGEHVAALHGVSPNEFMEVGREQFPAGAELTSKFSFGPHPHVLHVLCMCVGVVMVHKVVLMDND